ncbi:hypothetical protein GGR57DRAFT_510621 [Xylariaceae sp. FL1272]|nr:hypothetical protein GGR57DRAFT_510621 [Xylariaceae sp. FL1272]
MRVYSIGRIQSPRLTDETIDGAAHPRTDDMISHQNNIYHLLNGLVEGFAAVEQPIEEENNRINDIVGHLLNYEFGVNVRPRGVDAVSDSDCTIRYAVQIELKPFEETHPSHCHFILRYIFEQVCQYLIGENLAYGIDIVHKTIIDQIHPNRRWTSHSTDEKPADPVEQDKQSLNYQHAPVIEKPPQIVVQDTDAQISDCNFPFSKGRASWISLQAELRQIVLEA